jgi:hypothetical protein
MLPPRPVSPYLTFSPLPFDNAQGGYFLLRYYTLADIFPLGNMVLFVARTFLPFKKKGRWNSLLPCKVNILTLILILLFNNGYFYRL